MKSNNRETKVLTGQVILPTLKGFQKPVRVNVRNRFQPSLVQIFYSCLIEVNIEFGYIWKCIDKLFHRIN
jgi:hypothetical protein